MVSRTVNTKPKSALDDAVRSRYLKDLRDQFVIVPADKVPFLKGLLQLFTIEFGNSDNGSASSN